MHRKGVDQRYLANTSNVVGNRPETQDSTEVLSKSSEVSTNVSFPSQRFKTVRAQAVCTQSNNAPQVYTSEPEYHLIVT